MTVFEQWMIGIGICSVLAAMVVVIVAIWGERIRQWWSKPKLFMSLSEPALTTTTDAKKETRRGWFYVVTVKNSRRSSSAAMVQILLMQVLKKAPDGTWEEQTFSGPVPVTWRWPDLMPFYETVGPDKQATFGHLTEGSASFFMSLCKYPNNLQCAIGRDDPTRLVFKAVSRTTDSRPLTIEVAWDGKWVEGSAEMSKHLIVREVSA